MATRRGIVDRAGQDKLVRAGAFREAQDFLAHGCRPTDRAGGRQPLDDGLRVSRRGGQRIWTNWHEDDRRLPDGRTIRGVSFLIESA